MRARMKVGRVDGERREEENEGERRE